MPSDDPFNNHPFNRLISLLNEQKYLSDIFYLLHVGDVDLASVNGNTPVLLVPKSLHELFASSKYDELLLELLQWARPSMRENSPQELNRALERIHHRYVELLKRGRIEPIDDESDPEVATAIQEALDSHRRSLSKEALDRLHRGLTTILTASKRQAKALLMRGRGMVRLLRDHVIELELPSKIDAATGRKAELARRLIPLKTCGSAKWLISIAVGAAALAFPPFGMAGGAAGIALLLTDP